MRARPDHDAKFAEREVREYPYRLQKQLAKLTKVIPIVLNKTEIDSEVMARVRGVVMGTSDGVTLDIAQVLRRHQEKGITHGQLLLETRLTKAKLDPMLVFLRNKAIRIVSYREENGSKVYRLMPEFLTQYDSVFKAPTI
jgi:hypothetical protein